MNCGPQEIDYENYPNNASEVFDSVMIYKYHTNNMNSNLASIYYDPDVVKNTPSLRNVPNMNEEYLVGALNEGSSVNKNCRTCNDETDEMACMKNVAIMQDDYCPIIKKCDGMPEMQNSDSYKTLDGLDDKVKSTRGLIEGLSNLRKNVEDRDKYYCQTQLCFIRENADYKTRFNQFTEIYYNIKNKMFKESIDTLNDDYNIDFSNSADPTVSKLIDFLTDPINVCYFNLPSKYRIRAIIEGQENIFFRRIEAQDATLIPNSVIVNAFKNVGNTETHNGITISVYLDQKDTKDYMMIAMRTMMDNASDLTKCSNYKNIECN
jgi:hypothetical protein